MPAANEFGMHEYLKTLTLTQSLSRVTHRVVMRIKSKRKCIKMNPQCLACREVGESVSKVIEEHEHVKICRYTSLPLKLNYRVANFFVSLQLQP